MESGKLYDEIVEALKAAFPDPGDMDRVVGSADIGVSFGEYKVGRPTYPQALRALVADYADPQGLLVPLLKAAQEKNPRNQRLRKVMDLVDQFGALRADKSFGEAERIVLKGVLFEDVGVWIEKLKAKRRAVCRVEPQPQNETTMGYGTGFLVAEDVIITNFHVAGPFWDDKTKAGRVVLRFGYETDSSGVEVSGGVEYKLASTWRGPGAPTPGADRPWQVLSSPEDKLDFALLRLEKAAGEELVDGVKRGFLTLTSWRFHTDDGLLILQHPYAAPLKLAIGAVESLDPPNRVLYKVNTEEGSSGSPCLNQKLETAALHHFGQATNNRGVTLEAIRAQLSTQRDALIAQGLEELIA